MELLTPDEVRALVALLLKLPNVQTDQQARRQLAASLPDDIVQTMPFSNVPLNDMYAIVRAGNAASAQRTDSSWPIQRLIEDVINQYVETMQAQKLRTLLDGALARARQAAPVDGPGVPPNSDALTTLLPQVVKELEGLRYLRSVLDMRPEPPVARLRQLPRTQVLQETIVQKLERIKHTDTALNWMPQALAIKRLDNLRRTARGTSEAFDRCLRAISELMALKPGSVACQRSLIEARQSAIQAHDQCSELRDSISQCLRERN